VLLCLYKRMNQAVHMRITASAMGVSLSRPKWYRFIGQGMYLDLKGRIPHFKSDWTDAWNYLVIPVTWVSRDHEVIPLVWNRSNCARVRKMIFFVNVSLCLDEQVAPIKLFEGHRYYRVSHLRWIWYRPRVRPEFKRFFSPRYVTACAFAIPNP
jgi:hypothetical protein